MNQGHDVIEFIHGNFVKPADYPLLEYQFEGLPFAREVDELLERFQALIPMFRELNALAFRELIIESDILVAYPAGAERKGRSAQDRGIAPQARRASRKSAHHPHHQCRIGHLRTGRVRHVILHDSRR